MLNDSSGKTPPRQSYRGHQLLLASHKLSYPTIPCLSCQVTHEGQESQRKMCLQQSSVCWQMQNAMPQKSMVLAGVCLCHRNRKYVFYLPGIRKSFQYTARQTSESGKQVLKHFFARHSAASYKYTETPSCNSA